MLSSKILFLGVLLGVLLLTNADRLRKTELIKSVVNTCTACNYAKALIDNNPPLDDITTYLKEQCQIYGKKGGPKEFCYNIEEHVKYGFRLLKIYAKIGCDDFCGRNEKVLSIDMVCDLGKYLIENMDTFMDLYLPKVAKYICKDKKDCADGMIKSRAMIEGFIKRIILRGSKIVDSKNYCGIDITKIQMGHRVLEQKDANLTTGLLCDLCARFADYMNNTIFNDNAPFIEHPFWIEMGKLLVPICKLLPENVQQSFQNCAWQSIVSLIETIFPALQECIPNMIIIPTCPQNQATSCRAALSALPPIGRK